jgi:hypothetical protein
MITKHQLRRIIKEVTDDMYGDDMHGDEAEYNRGYQDGFDSVPPARDATADYDIGYEDGEGDATIPEPELDPYGADAARKMRRTGDRS